MGEPKHKRKSFYLPALGIPVFWFFTQLGSTHAGSIETERFLNPPPEHIEYFHFGFRESMADSLWLRWIQDSDTCQTYLQPVEYLDKSKTKAQGVNPRYKICDQSWSFKMLDAVTRLAPKFAMPYLAGGSTLAILVEDYEGATLLYERGLTEYPNDWQLLYRAAFHFLFNLKQKEKAADLLSRSADLGGPDWLKSLAARILTEVGQLEFALANLKSYRESIMGTANEDALKNVNRRINDLEKRLAARSQLDGTHVDPIFKPSEFETQ